MTGSAVDLAEIPAGAIGGRGAAATVSFGWLLAPAAVLYGCVALLPFLLIIRLSFADGLAHYAAVFGSPLLSRAAINTALIALTTTMMALLLAIPLAGCLWRAGPRARKLYLALILLPFWTAVLIKNFAWIALLQDNGAVNLVLMAVGVTERPLTLLHNRFAVTLGMVHFVLPYAVFPIYSAMRGIDGKVVNAARSLGATNLGVIRFVILPLIMPGLASAGLLVFIVSAGFFITPVILGAPSDMMMSNLVDYYVHELVDFNKAAVIAVLILVGFAPLFALQQPLARRGQYGAG